MISFSDVRKKVEEYLKTDDFTITFAKQEEDVWRLNIHKKGQHAALFSIGAITLDAITGKVKQFKKGQGWAY